MIALNFFWSVFFSYVKPCVCAGHREVHARRTREASQPNL